MAKFEKTCICKYKCSFKGAFDKTVEFVGGREYQVDILCDANKTVYKVYKNGESEIYATISEPEFNRCFHEMV